MSQENPYQAPQESSWQSEDSLGDGFYPATRCPNCNADITFWMGLKQPTPFRLKCSRCETEYALHAPFMSLIAVLVTIGAVLAVGMTGLGVIWLGFWTLWLSIPMLIAACLALEWATYCYVMSQGKLAPLANHKQPQP